VIIEVFLICVLNYYDEVGVINLDGLGDWLMYEVDDVQHTNHLLRNNNKTAFSPPNLH